MTQDASRNPHGVPIRLSSPRIQPIVYDKASSLEQAAIDLFGFPPPSLNIFTTIANAPEAAAPFLAWANYVMGKGTTLAPRIREIVILRIGALCRSGYEFAQHWQIGLQSGLTTAEMTSIKLGNTDGWAPGEAALISACTDIVSDHFVSDRSWADLIAHYSERQAMDIVFTAGQYVQVSIMLNSLGVQLEPELARVSQ